MNIKRSIYALILAVALSFQALALPAHAEETGFPSVRTYEGQFTDVSAGDWYYDPVKTLYELGLTNGTGDGDRFEPDGELTVAEVVTMAARLRSLYETGDSEAGPAAFAAGDGAWYLPYAAYLQDAEVLGQELEGAYDRPALRAEMAHVLAGALPQERFDPVNRETVAAGLASGQYLRDVTAETPYREDILLLYGWGVVGGSDQTGSYLPEERISRGEAAAMAARLAREELRLALDWEILPAYSKKGTAMPDLVYSSGTFYESPGADDLEQIDADIRFMLSRGEREIILNYPAGTLTDPSVERLMNTFLNTARNYVEQTYNNIFANYSLRTGFVQLIFSSSLYEEAQIDRYRDETMEYAIKVHDQMWAEGKITEEMSEYDKAKVYFAWICGHCRYDHQGFLMSHSGYQAFTTGLAVCDGYTAAYNLLLKLEGIECGTWSTVDHIWTTAVLDGTPCHIDTTWGDQNYGIEYRFFAMTEAEATARF